ILLSLSLLQSTNYNIVADEKMLVLPCSKEEDRGNAVLSDFVDVTDLQLELDKDLQTFHISCDIKIKLLPKGPIKMQVDVYRWERGQWSPTVFALKRDDICRSLVDPFEIWHLYIVTQIPKSQRTCPPKLGQVYNLRNITNRMTLKNMPRWDIEGDLKSVVHFTVGSKTICALAFVTITIE
ncbi:uncharacterized protein LOC133847844, partial [Drosophila sulfurigaster albostrigata]|uniref:uncharacterized protein LOC133847844 n=1 Tax=Drosophila sulfurigaster albostrigata TaxID=89887 RepID=UPI002D21DA88